MTDHLPSRYALALATLASEALDEESGEKYLPSQPYVAHRR